MYKTLRKNVLIGDILIGKRKWKVKIVFVPTPPPIPSFSSSNKIHILCRNPILCGSDYRGSAVQQQEKKKPIQEIKSQKPDHIA